MAKENCTTSTQTVEVLKWVADYPCPWASLPTLTRYRPTDPEDDQPAARWQKTDLRRFHVRPTKRGLTYGEARYLVYGLIELNKTFAVTAWKPGKAWHLRYGIWCPGMTRKQRQEIERYQKMKSAPQWADIKPGQQ